MIKSQQKLHRNFIKATISSRLKCPICFEVFFKPRRLYCGHTFCKPCLQELCNAIHHKNPQHINTCPLCRTPIDVGNIGYDLFAKRIINQLQVTCPVNGCPWKGENQLLPTHYHFQCKMKNYVRKLSKQNKNINALVQQEFNNKEDDVRQKINENVQKGFLISRVISKNPHLFVTNSAENDRLPSNNQIIPKKNLVTRSTQTYPVRIIPIRKKQVKVPRVYKAPIDINNPIIPMNGVTPIPTYIFQSNKPSMLTRIKRQSHKPLNESEQQKDIEQLYVQMGVNFYDSNNNNLEVQEIISSEGNDESSSTLQNKA